MAVIHIRNKEVQIKIVYVGPGRGGKTTNLEYIFKKIRHRILADMVSIKTHGDRTLFFDFCRSIWDKFMAIESRPNSIPYRVRSNIMRRASWS